MLDQQDEEKRHILADSENRTTEKKDECQRSSLPAASFNYVNSIVGSGIIGMAYAINQAGVLLGVFLILFMGLVTDFSLVMLIRASRISGTHSYQGVVNAAFGFPGYAILSFLQFIYPFIAMVSYNVIVGDTVTKVLVFYAGLGPDSIWARRELVIGMTTLILSLPLALHDGMARFSRASFVSLLITMFVLATLVIRLFTYAPIVPQSSDAWTLVKPGITQAIAVASFAYMCHHSTFLIYGSLEQPSEERWARLTHVSVFISATIEIFYGLFGYATFTGLVQGDLLENYCRGDHLMNISRILFCLTILLTAPIECFVARDVVLYTLFERNDYRDHQPMAGMNLKKFLVTTSLVLAAALLSFTTDCLSIVLEFNGVLAAIPLAYILPAFCYMRIGPEPLKSKAKVFSLLMGIFGIVITIWGIVMIFVNWSSISTCSHGVEMSYCYAMNNATNSPVILRAAGRHVG